MREGWLGEDYLILLDEAEITDLTNRYDIATYVVGQQNRGSKGLG